MIPHYFKVNKKAAIPISKWLILIWTMLVSINIQAVNEFPEGKKQPLKWSKEGLSILLKDDLNLPNMFWPLTLLEYPVDFSSGPINVKDVVLIDKGTNLNVPFQITDAEMVNGKIRKGVLCFLSDLPSGAKKAFRLTPKIAIPDLQTNSVSKLISVLSKDLETVISNGIIKVRIPSAGDYQKMIPPIIQIGSGTQWLGQSVMPSNLLFQKLKVSKLHAGPLFAQYLIDYQFAGGKRFQLKLRLVAGMDYLETEENMTGFTEADSLAWKIDWNGFQPEFRFCPNRPGAPTYKEKRGYDSFVWEKIGGSDGDPLAVKHPDLPYDQKNLPDGLLPFKITPYHNWMTWWCLPSAAFWSEKSGQTVALFIKDFEKWVDPAYPIWSSKDNLSVHFYYKNGFYWSFPLVTGKRSLALTVYPHEKDVEVANRTNSPQVYVDYLRRWYGWISLNKTKDWVLDYPSGKPAHPAFFKLPQQEAKFNPKDLMSNLKRTVGGMADAGERSKGPTPVGTRTFYDNITPLFENA
jgi:hypothetical protein